MSSSSESDELEIEPRRIFRRRINFSFSISDFSFNEKFRVSKTTVEFLLTRIGCQLEHKTNRNHALKPLQQILCTLHWIGSGSQYHVNGDSHGLSKSTVHRCIKRVSTLIVNVLLGDEVRWPASSYAVPQLFSRYTRIPRIAGIVDGSLFPIDAPRVNEAAYVDRKGGHSINGMVVCGPNLEFFYASIRWPGSVHDARVLRCSSLNQKWQDGWRPFPNAIILGDSGYRLKNWLITPNIPLEIERNLALTRFLRMFKSTRRMVENSLGILKEKFPCLNHLRLQPITTCRVIISCIILHNIEKRLGSELYMTYDLEDDDIDDVAEDDEAEDDGEENVVDNNAVHVLRSLIAQFN